MCLLKRSQKTTVCPGTSDAESSKDLTGWVQMLGLGDFRSSHGESSVSYAPTTLRGTVRTETLSGDQGFSTTAAPLCPRRTHNFFFPKDEADRAEKIPSMQIVACPFNM